MLKMVCYGMCALLLGALSGCGSDSESSRQQSSQVVAKVNGEEITVHQLNQILARIKLPKGQEVSREEIEQKALESLIERTLVLQAAKNVKLDREPAVLSALEEAKQKVLIDRYVQRALESVEPPSDEKIEQFYNDFPELFAERKMYVFTKLAISADSEEAERLIEQVKQEVPIEQIVMQLERDNLEYRKMSEAKGEGNLANPILHFLSALQPGDVGYLKMTDGLLIIKLHSVLDQSVRLSEAKEVIARQLLMDERKKASKKLVDSLKKTAEIEYVGKFATKDK